MNYSKFKPMVKADFLGRACGNDATSFAADKTIMWPILNNINNLTTQLYLKLN